jgi:hypothetical protein
MTGFLPTAGQYPVLLEEIQEWSGQDVTATALEGLVWAFSNDPALRAKFNEVVDKERKQLEVEMEE